MTMMMMLSLLILSLSLKSLRLTQSRRCLLRAQPASQPASQRRRRAPRPRPPRRGGREAWPTVGRSVRRVKVKLSPGLVPVVTLAPRPRIRLPRVRVGARREQVRDQPECIPDTHWCARPYTHRCARSHATYYGSGAAWYSSLIRPACESGTVSLAGHHDGTCTQRWRSELSLRVRLLQSVRRLSVRGVILILIMRVSQPESCPCCAEGGVT